MAAASSGSIIHVPGRLISNPTDLGLAEPYGGTYLGMMRSIRFKPKPIYRTSWAEELGTVGNVWYLGEGPCELSGILRYPDSDAILAATARPVSSGSSGTAWQFRPYHSVADSTHTQAGTSLALGFQGTTVRAIKLLFAPRAAADHPMIFMHNAIPVVDESIEIPMSFKDEWAMPIRFIGIPNSTGYVYKVAQRANININE